MQVSRLVIPDVMLVSPRRLEDKRGFFSEIYNREALRQYGIAAEFIQDNSSLSSRTGTIRGLHFQLAPQAQAKLIMVPRGRIFDVAVDCRKESRTYGQHVSVELSADAWNQLFIPHGFAHGFCTLEPDTTVLYKVDAPYAPDLEGGILWNDPDLNIQWPLAEDQAIVSDKDLQLPRFRDLGALSAAGRQGDT